MKLNVKSENERGDQQIGASGSGFIFSQYFSSEPTRWDYLLDQRPSLVLSRHHDGHPSHAADVGGCEGGRGQWWWEGGTLWLAVGLRHSPGLGQLAATLLY